MDVRQLRYFLAVFEHGNLSRAARALGVAPATLSMQLAALEEALGVPLFKRSRGGLTALAASERLYRLGRPLHEELKFIVQYLRAGASRPPRELTVSIPLAAPGSALATLVLRSAASVGYKARIVAERAEAALHVGYCVGKPSGRAVPGKRERWLAVEVPAGAAVPGGARFSFAMPGAPIAGRGLVEHAQRVLQPAAGRELPVLALSSPGAEAEPGAGRRVCLLPAFAAPPMLVSGAFRTALLPSSDYDPHRTVEAIGQGAEREIAVLAARLRRSDAGAAKKDRDALEIGTRPLRYFVAVYEEGGIAAAASRLHVVQPAVSMLVSKLERALGSRLFERTSRGAQPTQTGHLFYDLVHPPLQDLQDLARQLRVGPRGAARPLRVGVIPALNENSILAESLAAAVAAWSPADGRGPLRVVEAYGAQLCRWVRHEMLDLAIVDARASSGIGQATPITTEPMVVVSDAAKRLLPTGPISLAKLARLPMVLPSERHGIRTLLEECFQEARLPLVPELEIDSMASALRLIREQSLVTVLPVSAIYGQHRQTGLALNRITHPRMQRTMTIVACPPPHAAPGAAEFAEAFTKALRSALERVSF